MVYCTARDCYLHVQTETQHVICPHAQHAGGSIWYSRPNASFWICTLASILSHVQCICIQCVAAKHRKSSQVPHSWCSHELTVTDIPDSQKAMDLLLASAVALLVLCACGIPSQQEVLPPAHSTLLRLLFTPQHSSMHPVDRDSAAYCKAMQLQCLLSRSNEVCSTGVASNYQPHVFA